MTSFVADVTNRDYRYSFCIDQFRYFAKLIRRHYRDDRKLCVFEIGSRDAADAFLLGTLLPKGTQIVCFDPHPLFPELARPFGAVNSDIRLENCAIAEVSGELPFYRTDTPDLHDFCDDLGIGASSLKVPIPNLPGLPTTSSQKIVAAALRGDAYCDAHNLQPDVLILDVQGAELEVLRSFGPRLEKIGIIFTECNIRNGTVYQDDASMPQIMHLLADYGFHLTRAYDISALSCDLIFVNHKAVSPNRHAPPLTSLLTMKVATISRLKRGFRGLRSRLRKRASFG